MRGTYSFKGSGAGNKFVGELGLVGVAIVDFSVLIESEHCEYVCVL